MIAFDLDAAAQRLEIYILSLRNTAIDPDEPLALSVFDMVDEAMGTDNKAHPMTAVGMIHHDEGCDANKVLGGGYETEGVSVWSFIILCRAMRGPRGAMTVSGLLKDGLNNFHVDGPRDEESGTGGACPLSVIRRKRFVPQKEFVKAVCGYELIATHPVVN